MKTATRVWLNCIQFAALIILSTSANAQLKADFGASPQIGCPPMVVNFEDKSTGDPTEWKWDLGNGTISFLKSPIATYFNPGRYTVKLVVKNQSGTDSIARTEYIVVHQVPTTNFSASDTTGCFPLKVNFRDSSAAGSGTIASWQWDFGDGNLSTLQNPEHTYINAGDFTVTLRVINTNGCVKVFTRPAYIRLTKGVKADFSFALTSNCKSPSLVEFTNRSEGTGAISYKWDFGNSSTSTQTNPVASYANTGLYTVALIATSSTGCTDTVTRKDFVNVAFVKATFTSDATACVGATTNFTNTSVPAPISAFWNFGDGTTSTAISPSKKYTSPGVYTVKLVNTFSSCADSVTKTITVLEGPKVSFDASSIDGCKVPHPVTFSNTSTGGVSYFWSFGDGKTSTLMNPVYTYTKLGTYAVKLVVTNANGCKDSLTKNQLVRLVAPEIKSVSGLPVRGCIPYTIKPVPNITSNQSITGYIWDFGDGTTSTNAQPEHTYNQAGSYSVKLIVLTSEGCSDTLIMNDGVRVGIKPKSEFVADPLEVCAQVKVTFTDQSTGTSPIDEWFWQFGDGGISLLQNPLHQYTDTGKFNVTLITTNFGCSDTLIKARYIQVKPPIARFDTAFQCSTPLTRNFIDKSLGATTWSWDFGDGTSSDVASPSHTYAKPGNYKVGLKVSNGVCEHSVSKFVKVVQEDPRLLSTDSITCRNARMTYTVTNVTAANIVNYTWYPLGSATVQPIVSTLYALAHYYNEPGVQTPFVIIKDVLGCLDTISTKTFVTINGPTAGFSVPFTSTCSVNEVPFNDTSKSDGKNPIAQYIWNYGDGSIVTSTAGPFIHKYDSAGVFGVRLTIVDSYGCRDSVFKPNLLTISKPIAKYSISDTLVCPNVPVRFINFSSGNGLTYKWSFGDGETSTATNISHTYAAEGRYNINLTLLDKFGCTSSMDTMVHIVQTTAKFLMSDSFSSCPPLLVDFTNQSKGFTVMSYDFGDGGISTLNNPSHIYTYPGTYFVKLGIKNNGGCTDTIIKKVVIQGPTGVFRYNPLIVCNPGKIDFTATTRNAVKYIWDYNDGTTIFSSLTSTSHTYSRPGNFIPKLILEDNSGCKVPVVGSDTIRVKFVETNIVSAASVICDSGFVAFKDSSITNDALQSFTWNFGDGQSSTSRNVNHHYTKAGLYTVKLITRTATGCLDSAQLINQVKVVDGPKIRIIGDTSSCVPGTITLTAGLQRADTSTLQWKWDFNGQTFNEQNPPAQVYNGIGKFAVRLAAVDSDGCKDSTLRYADIHPIPVVNAGRDSTICNAKAITLQATGAAQYTWAFDASLSCLNCDQPVAKPSVQTSYVVTGRSVFGCAASDTVIVNVTQPFKMRVNPGDTLCTGESITLGVSGADQYEWSPSPFLSNTNTSAPVARPDTSVTYQVIGRNNNSCFSDTGYVRLTVYPMPQMEILGEEVLTINVGSTVQLETKNSADIKEWKWAPATGLSCSTCASPKATPRESRTYTVLGSNAGRCVARDQITINLVCNNSNLYIPNTFSPNKDGNNDIFYPRSTGVFNIKSMRIFNRWGQVVFQNNSINPNNASAGWDGTLNGVALNPDVYVYIFDIVCENSAVFPVKGNITLLR